MKNFLDYMSVWKMLLSGPLWVGSSEFSPSNETTKVNMPGCEFLYLSSPITDFL